MSDHEEYNVGTMLGFKARLDLLDFRGATGDGRLSKFPVDTD